MMNDVSTNNIVRLCLHEHQMLLQVQQMRMRPEIFSKIVSSMKNNTNAVYIELIPLKVLSLHTTDVEM